MAPEQLEGREVTARSDLYSLGLVLYEMFTGRPPSRNSGRRWIAQPRIDSVAKDVDLAVARAIERCLELAPHDRPSSALAVAASLPGGNPLAEALAAGLTPSPQMVAAARSREALSVRASCSCWCSCSLAWSPSSFWQPSQRPARDAVSVSAAGARAEVSGAH